MKTKIRKAFFNPEKEEKWLNEMAAKGLAMSSYTIFRYTFDDCTPGEYIYRMELLKDNPKTPESAGYIRFMEDSGVEYVDSYFSWVYFRKKAADGAFEIYSDFDSKIKHYQRISNLLLMVVIIEFMLAVTETVILTNAVEEGGPWIAPAVAMALILVIAALILRLWRSYIKKIKRLKAEREISE